MKWTIAAALAGLAASMFVCVAPASAQATRTWVSGVGNDTNPCSRAAPCKTWQGAMSKTAACGEIDALDPGDFGVLSIAKGVTIDGGGGQVASILVSGTNGIIIDDTDPTCTRVIIRNLRIASLAPSPSANLSLYGIFILQGDVLLEHVDVQNFVVDCVNFQMSDVSQLTIINSDFVGCANAGLEAQKSGGGDPVQVSITGSTFEQNGIGVSAEAGAWVSIHNSMLSGNTGGVQSSGALARVFMDNSSITNNTSFGVYATNNGSVGLAANSVTLSLGSGLKLDTGGTIISSGNNWVQLVHTNSAPSSTIAPE